MFDYQHRTRFAPYTLHRRGRDDVHATSNQDGSIDYGSRFQRLFTAFDLINPQNGVMNVICVVCVCMNCIYLMVDVEC